MGHLSDDQFEGYDEHLQPADKPGMVELAGRKLPAVSFQRGEFAHNFVTPLENGALAHVKYFHKSQQVNVSMVHAQSSGAGEGFGGRVHLRMAGVVGPDGKDQDDYQDRIAKIHGERKPDLPRTPEEALGDLDYYSKREVPKHVQEDNRKHMGALGQQWGWKP